MYAQVDDESQQFQLLAEIRDHRKNWVTISKEEVNIRSANGTERDKITTKVWEIMVLWKDGYMDWIQLKNIKVSNLAKVAEYVAVNHIQC